jgi:prevent-host-death family protein
MKPMKISENIVPLGEFKTHAARVLRDMKSSHAPVVITQNGKPTAVLLTPEEFDQLSEQARFVRAVQDGLEQAGAGQLISDEDLEKDLDKEFGPLPKRQK